MAVESPISSNVLGDIIPNTQSTLETWASGKVPATNSSNSRTHVFLLATLLSSENELKMRLKQGSKEHKAAAHSLTGLSRFRDKFHQHAFYDAIDAFIRKSGR